MPESSFNCMGHTLVTQLVTIVVGASANRVDRLPGTTIVRMGLRAKGVQGAIYLDGSILHFEDEYGRIVHTVPLDQVRKIIRFAPGRLGKIGALQFLTVGGQIIDATRASFSSNSLGFKPRDYEAASEFADAVESMLTTSSIPVAAAVGSNGTVLFDGQIIEVQRPAGWPLPGSSGGSKRLSLTSISAVELKPASNRYGYIQFTVPGGIERRALVLQADDAYLDENSIAFSKAQESNFIDLRTAIEAAMRLVTQSSSSTIVSNPAAQLKDLWDLHLAGAMTREEFETQKSRLLGSS